MKLHLPLLAAICVLLFSLPPVTAAYFNPAQLSVALPGSILGFFRQYVPSQSAIFRTEEADPDPEEFWGRARELGDAARKYSQKLMEDAAATSQDVREKIEEMKERVQAIIGGATALHDLQVSMQSRLAGRSSDEKSTVGEDLERALGRVIEELQIMFPPPGEAPGHENRQKMVVMALEKTGVELKAVCAKHGMDEDFVAAHWETIRGAIEKLVVLLGDLVEQHPNLLSALLFTGAVMLIPEYWVLRPVLGLFGFGPIGPGKATAASWAQRVFYGAAVPKGSWFAFLQQAAMKSKAGGWLGWLGGAIGIGLGGLGALFTGCGGRK
ncbi:hypothetical protein MSAN_01486500 [Mycena sanguinolenta]|uniref:Uncharacterized protein n=1 Tax=Mycena sanguinolenta TaxID=230812 RepID=A0A8H6YC11_9AGAR|nr:hypothetical protein MSAN_01486500 [Mycena sanguinolenta]